MPRVGRKLVCLLATVVAVAWGRTPNPAIRAQPHESLPVARWRGAGSCAAAACHGGNGPAGARGSEYTTWAVHDPHARAVETLYTTASQRMAAALRLPPAHEAALCLRCHVSPTLDPKNSSYQKLRADGVSCEACHGASSNWLTLHHTAAWRGKTEAEKAALGLQPTKDVLFRARLCTSCHVGTGDADVNHDLLAAGHPPLRFELSAFHGSLPKHWDVTREKHAIPDLDARLWSVGQPVAAQAALELLAARAAGAAESASPRRPWPELAEYNCASCHHALTGKLPAAGRGRAWPEWNSWSLPLARWLVRERSQTTGLDRALTDLAAQLNDRVDPDAARVAQAARDGAAAFDALAQAQAATPHDAGALRQMLQQLTDPQGGPPLANWDHATQLYVAVYSLTQSLREFGPVSPESEAALADLRKAIKERGSRGAFEPTDAAEFRRHLQIIHRAVPAKERP